MHRIEVAFMPDAEDALGERTRLNIIEDLGLQVGRVRTVEVYTLDVNCSGEELLRLSKEIFTDPIIQVSTINQPVAEEFDWLIEVSYRPGVTDNVGRAAQEAVADLFGRGLGPTEGIYTGRQYLLEGDLTEQDAEKIAADLLANPLIQQWQKLSKASWDQGGRIETHAPLVALGEQPEVEFISLELSDDELLSTSRDRVLALSLDEMRAIRDHYRDPTTRSHRKQIGLPDHPTDVELEALAQTWSEHCKHKIFNARIEYREEGSDTETVQSLFQTYIKGATEKISEKVGWLLSVFHDNAGVVALNDDYSLVMKVETHNSPSALDPYGGALTGIVGVNRDPLGTGQGCRLLFNTDVFCFAAPDYADPLPSGVMHPKRIFKGVHRGVQDGANQSGIPDVNGAIVFDDRYATRPLVFCGTGGIMPARIHGEPSHEKSVHPGDHIVMVGGRIGKDGIHGATFSSDQLHSDSPVSAVQIGDPITQKNMLDLILEARDRNLYRCITDNGAGGLSSSVGEMAEFSGGADIELSTAPVKYSGLAPWEILLSEAQERMTLAVPPEKIDEFLDLSKHREVESTVLGTFNDSGRFHVSFEGNVVADLSLEFLHNGVPQLDVTAKWKAPRFEEPDHSEPRALGPLLHRVLSRWNVCSKEVLVRQYDHEVQATSVIKPFVGIQNDGPGDAAVLRPIYGEPDGVIVSCGIIPRYGDIDTYHMAACCVDEAVRNAISVGADPKRMAGLDNFCWPDPIVAEGNPEAEYKMAQLVRACRGLADACKAYSVPCISGKDSMKNDYREGIRRLSIPPTLLFSVIGMTDDVNRSITLDVKAPGDFVYIVGRTRAELGGSEYFAELGFVGNQVPKVRFEESLAAFQEVAAAIRERQVQSCHDCSDGGLGAALAECAFSGGFGVEIDLNRVPAENISRDDELLFSESAGRFVMTVKPEHAESFEQNFASSSCSKIGTVRDDDRFRVRGTAGQIRIDESISPLKESWQNPLKW